MNHYPHHIGDFNSATRHLTRVERSLYRDMLDLYYDTEQPLNSDVQKLARRLIASSEEERAALQVVLEEFFTLEEDGWHNHRCDTEIAKYQGQIEQASRAGKASAAKRSNSKAASATSGFEGEGNKDSTVVERALNERTTNQNQNQNQEEEAKASLSPGKPDDEQAEGQPAGKEALPHCPHGELIDLFAEQLPTLPRPKRELWSGAREAALKARWRWVLTAKKRDGTRYAETREEAMDWFRRFFGYVAQSDFLTGRDGRWTACDLGWLCNETNFAKVVQGNYDNREAA